MRLFVAWRKKRRRRRGLVEMVELRDANGQRHSYWVNGVRVSDDRWWDGVMRSPHIHNLSMMAFPIDDLLNINRMLSFPLEAWYLVDTEESKGDALIERGIR